MIQLLPSNSNNSNQFQIQQLHQIIQFHQFHQPQQQQQVNSMANTVYFVNSFCSLSIISSMSTVAIDCFVSEIPLHKLKNTFLLFS